MAARAVALTVLQHHVALKVLEGYKASTALPELRSLVGVGSFVCRGRDKLGRERAQEFAQEGLS